MGVAAERKVYTDVIVQDSRGISRSHVQDYRETIGHAFGIPKREKGVLSSVEGFSRHMYGTLEKTGNYPAQSF